MTALPVIENQRVIGVVVAARTPKSVGEVLAEKRWHLIGLLSLLVAAAATLSLLGRWAIGRPLRAVADRARRVSEGERGALAVPAPGAVREVAEMSEEERDRFLSNLKAEATRLATLVQRLLDLARAEMPAFAGMTA